MNIPVDLNSILKNGITIKSSGSSGIPKDFFQPPDKIKKSSEIANEVQKINRKSKIYTCCKLTHAGGLLAQTIPGLMIGAKVDIEPFNAYEFTKKINNYTHSHITPLHAKAIMMTKLFKNLDLSGITLTCGAEPITWDIIESFVSKKCNFIVNWGMSEVGPIAINKEFKNIEEVNYVKSINDSNVTIMGSNIWCDYKILDDGELSVKGDICIHEDWYNTKDIVLFSNGYMFYKGRIGTPVNFLNPTKG